MGIPVVAVKKGGRSIREHSNKIAWKQATAMAKTVLVLLCWSVGTLLLASAQIDVGTPAAPPRSENRPTPPPPPPPQPPRFDDVLKCDIPFAEAWVGEALSNVVATVSVLLLSFKCEKNAWTLFLYKCANCKLFFEVVSYAEQLGMKHLSSPALGVVFSSMYVEFPKS